MTSRLSPIQARIAALFLLCAIVASLAGVVAYSSWRLHHHYDLAIEEYSDRLERYRRIASLRPAIDEAIIAVENRHARRFFLQAEASALAGAELQRLVTGIVEKHNGRMTSSQVLPAKEDAKNKSAATISVMIQMNAAVVPLQMILHALESNEPYLFVDQLTVRGGHGRNYKEVPGTQPDFFVQMTVSAYLSSPLEGKS
jgi:hypothetical protein